MSDELTPEIAKKAVEQLRKASEFQTTDSYALVGIEGYGILHLRNSNPTYLETGNGRGAKWEDIPAEHQAKILELLANPPSRGSMTVSSVDTEKQTIYFKG